MIATLFIYNDGDDDGDDDGDLRVIVDVHVHGADVLPDFLPSLMPPVS